MGKYRKKPVVIEAEQWFKNGDHPAVRKHDLPGHQGEHSCRHCGCRLDEHGWVDTLEDGHVVCPGDWIITGVKGEKYSIKPDIFAETYEAVES